MSGLINKLREAIIKSTDIEKAELYIKPLVPEFGFRYEVFECRPQPWLIASIKDEFGIEISEPLYGYKISLAEPFPAGEFCQIMGWKRAYGFSGDVNMITWRVCVPEIDLQDRRFLPKLDNKALEKARHSLQTGQYPILEKKRPPRLGEWNLEINLDDWPKGEPVGILGASPAYDLQTSISNVIQIKCHPLIINY